MSLGIVIYLLSILIFQNGDDDGVNILAEESTTASAANLRFGNQVLNTRLRAVCRNVIKMTCILQMRRGLACALDNTVATHDERRAGGAVIVKTSGMRASEKVNLQPGTIMDRMRQKHPDTTNFARNFHLPSEKGVAERSHGIAQKVNGKAPKDKIFFKVS